MTKPRPYALCRAPWRPIVAPFGAPCECRRAKIVEGLRSSLADSIGARGRAPRRSDVNSWATALWEPAPPGGRAGAFPHGLSESRIGLCNERLVSDGSAGHRGQARPCWLRVSSRRREGRCSSVSAAGPDHSLGDVDLSDVRCLETIEHRGPSSIGVDTLFKSRGQIPAAFLRGAGVPNAIVNYVATLAGTVEPTQFLSCFISHSHADHEF
jgi:hypothetical protein